MTNELVFISSTGKDVTTSLKVAEIFGKDHDKVVRDIESLSCSNDFNTANFGVISYRDSMNRERRAYEMTKDGFSFLVMGYTGDKAGQFKEMFIREFNKRDALLKNDDYIISRAMSVLHQRVQRLQLQTEEQARMIEANRPKVLFAESVAGSHDSILIDNLAKVLKQNGIDIGGKRLFQYLRDNGYLGVRGEYYNMPTQAAMNLGLFEIKMHTISSANSGTKIKTTTKVTPKGQIYFINHFLRKRRAA